MSESPVRQFLKDYHAPNFQILNTHLEFDIQDQETIVTSELTLKRTGEGPLLLNGPGPSLQSITVITPSGKPEELKEGCDFTLSKNFLTLSSSLKIQSDSGTFNLKIVTRLKPQDNTSLEGLYQTGSGLCTQCEPESFRHITFFMDRPDIMSRFTTGITADRYKYPVLLSNGNCIKTEIIDERRHRVLWEDPFPKPCYLFALVAGDYDVLRDQFTTRSGRNIKLEIYCQKGNTPKCHHAMAALKRSMKWDEQAYDREYDLDQYLILAVDDFNGGAMENKGLNIFNSLLVFADIQSAADVNFDRVESVIAHEYFHNWTGNRITLRDWFQLSLKEGLTVFREQNYMMDLTSAALKRIDDVQFLRHRQFPEDAGPNAHPVRPESCFAVDNFFTTTVYEKGAEVIRMLKQLLGDVGFAKGMAYYFKTYDGQSITIEDFLKSFEVTNHRDLSQFKRWYSQAGTPKVEMKEQYNSETQTYSITLIQTCAPTPGQNTKEPFVIPIKLSLLSTQTKAAIPLELGKNEHDFICCTDSHDNQMNEIVLELNEHQKTWSFHHCENEPIPSILRGFTAPVTLHWEASDAKLEFLALHDTDGFNRWECLQKKSVQELQSLYFQARRGESPSVSKSYVTLFSRLIGSALENPELTARLVDWPSPDFLIQTLPLGYDPLALSEGYSALGRELASRFEKELWALDSQLSALQKDEDLSFKAMGIRSLLGQVWKILGYQKANHPALLEKFKRARTMNQQGGLLRALNGYSGQDERQEALALFENQWKEDPLTMNKWLQWQAEWDNEESVDAIEELCRGPHFKASNPNKVRSLLGVFISSSWRGFHRMDGKGYGLIKQKILEVDKLNPSTAARTCGGFENWYRLEPKRKALMKQMMLDILESPGLSKNCYEILKRSVDFDQKDAN